MSHTPLFHPRAVARALASTPPPPDLIERHQRLAGLIELDRSGELARTLETSLQGDYIKTLFEAVLGYTTKLSDGRVWNIAAEHNVLKLGVKRADGGIGWYEAGKTPTLHAVLELKGASQDLDHAKGRALTPVQQAWDYAVQSSTCRWIIVSNYRELRLYHRGRSQLEYERFTLRELVGLDAFRRLLLLLGRDQLLPAAPDLSAPLDALLGESDRVQTEITDQLYKDYRSLRADLFADLRRAHSNLPPLDLLRQTQKLLDRVLFIAFAEDRGLMPRDILKRALTDDGFGGLWTRLKRVFTWVDVGDPKQRIPPFNGGLFAPDPELDALDPSDELLGRLRALSEYDFEEDVSVEVLGHIFEQSISDLEELRARATDEQIEGLSKRKEQGVFYTPAFVTRYIVQESLGPELSRSLENALGEHKPEEQKKGKAQQAAWERVWMDHRRNLSRLRVLDPACGSGAFLVAAYEALAREYERCNQELASLRDGQRDVFDLSRTILQGNLFGVDLNPESVEITRLSLWLKTAVAGQKLTALDACIVVGNSVCDDPAVAPRAFDWSRGRQVGDWSAPRTAAERKMAEAWAEGFDVVVGNPPYVRQELLAPALKEHLRARYQAFHGMADLFIYFFERGLDRLKPWGRLGFVVANKWLKGGYAEPLRAFLASQTRVEQIIDFGHAPIFPDADAFPSIVILRKRPPEESSAVAAVVFPREELASRGVEEFVAERRVSIPQAEFGAAPWSLEPPEVRALMARLREVGRPLGEVAGKPMYGIKTGCNEAFVIDEATRGALLREDPASSELIYPFLRGRDLDRWVAQRSDQYMIFARRGVQIERYPAVLRHLEGFREALEPKPAGFTGRDWPGRKPGSYKWYEIQDSVDYWEELLKPKIVYPDLAWAPQFALDRRGVLINDLCFCIPRGEPWIAAVLNSPVMWAYAWRNVIHGKDEVLRLKSIYMIDMPIPTPTPDANTEATALVEEAIQLTATSQQGTRDLLDWLRDTHGVAPPGRALECFATLEATDFLAEVKKRRPKAIGPLTPSAMRELRTLHEAERLPMLQRSARLRAVEQRLSQLVNQAFGLSADDVALVKKTAPPRTPPGL